MDCLLNEAIAVTLNGLWKSVDESHKHNVEWKKPDIREYITVIPFMWSLERGK